MFGMLIGLKLNGVLMRITTISLVLMMAVAGTSFAQVATMDEAGRVNLNQQLRDRNFRLQQLEGVIFFFIAANCCPVS